METYKGIQWYGGDDPNGNSGRICKGIQSTLACAAPEISQRCEQGAVQFVYYLNQRMVTPIQSDCRLVVPSNLPTKLNLTTTESPISNKTTPPKVKELTTSKSSAGFGLLNGQNIFGSIFVLLALAFLQIN